MFKVASLVLGLSFMAQVAAAKILVISDIDDTVKVSHILSKKGAVSSAVDSDSHFAGMPDLYRILDLSHQDIEFHYVSLAPKLLMGGRHQDFLDKNGFPITGLHMNPGVRQDKDLKNKVIRQLLAEKKPELVIYFGDNGQYDAVVYDQMVKEFPQVPSITYIREAYSSKLESQYPTMPGQIGFVTTLELAIDLSQRNLLHAKAYKHIEQTIYSQLNSENSIEVVGKMLFPWWQDCRDFKWQWDVKNPTERLIEIKDVIEERCSKY
ncbi:phosphatase domain-containing protein [Bdellovibrio reynosensis]|uniref:DUF2183 domain-containing protein n=1 Tax=Bdellovibrio reynosensis TaxID=2835041 RepID=A0ABY4CGP4_9BACT|nr:phosphatase domain-containing protein [Bdellovibrio reynosensis]UOF02851.1 DUF2183 domain-containing protein [Bdellovibrio reynosensis]